MDRHVSPDIPPFKARYLPPIPHPPGWEKLYRLRKIVITCKNAIGVRYMVPCVLAKAPTGLVAVKYVPEAQWCNASGPQHI